MYDLSWWLPCALDTKYSVSIQSNRLMVFSILSIYFFFLFILPITEMWVKIRRKNNSLRIPGVCWYVLGRVHSRSSPSTPNTSLHFILPQNLKHTNSGLYSSAEPSLRTTSMKNIGFEIKQSWFDFQLASLATLGKLWLALPTHRFWIKINSANCSSRTFGKTELTLLLTVLCS